MDSIHLIDLNARCPIRMGNTCWPKPYTTYMHVAQISPNSDIWGEEQWDLAHFGQWQMEAAWLIENLTFDLKIGSRIGQTVHSPLFAMFFVFFVFFRSFWDDPKCKFLDFGKRQLQLEMEMEMEMNLPKVNVLGSLGWNGLCFTVSGFCA